MTQDLLPVDANGNAIPVLAPRSSADHALNGNFTEVLAPDNQNTRTVSVFATDAATYIRVGTDDTIGMRLPQAALLAIKVDPTLPLQAKGSGSLNVSVQG